MALTVLVFGGPKASTARAIGASELQAARAIQTELAFRVPEARLARAIGAS